LDFINRSFVFCEMLSTLLVSAPVIVEVNVILNRRKTKKGLNFIEIFPIGHTFIYLTV
jgi:hypothetical protein